MSSRAGWRPAGLFVGGLVVLGLAGGCPSRSTSGAGVGTSGGETTRAGTGTATSTGAGTGDPICPPNPAYACAGPMDCGAEHPCGPLEEFDETGCLRPRCVLDADCPGGQVCYRHPDTAGIIDWCNDEEIPGECVCTSLLLGGCDRGWCVAAEDVPLDGNGLGVCEGPANCGDPGTNSEMVGDECVCEADYEWCSDDPDDYSCCPPEGTCPDPNSFYSNGLCYCNEGYQWCNPEDPDDLSCCEGP